jgi:hypothetical protein
MNIRVYQGGALPTGTLTLPGGVTGDPLFADTVVTLNLKQRIKQ